MMRSLFAAVSGLKTHQQRMDVIGNNIANVNTPGFKKSRVTFQDMLYQTIRGASRPVDGGLGGTNPIQMGPGVSIASIDTIFGITSFQDTGKATDLGIDGEGFFVLSDGSRNYYTRVGNFDFDSEGNLVSLLNGMHVMGWMAQPDGSIKTDVEPVNICINMSETEPAKATEKIYFAGNLDSRVPIYEDDNKTPSSKIIVRQTVYDSKGQEYIVAIELKKVDNNEWSWILNANSIVNSTGETIEVGEQSGVLKFDTQGKIQQPTDAPKISFTPAGSEEVNIVLNFEGLTQYGSEYTATIQSQDGYTAGTLESYTIDQSGTITGVFTNGVSRNLAQIALARFTNPAGLYKNGGSLYSETSNSGEPLVGTGGASGFGSIRPGSLEMSNVDLSSEFTEMIITQRGFQANSRVITASDEMLQELVNLKR
ncbi:MAG: flagellar hook protein FlgE [Thermacetogenium sp.]|nr:flagellar hook protein FlgE [Thermacetogenium sp.]